MKDATREVVGLIAAIKGAIGQIIDATGDMKGAMDEQGLATREVAQSVQRTAASTVLASWNMARVTPEAEATGRSADTVLHRARELASRSNQFARDVRSFLAAAQPAA